MSFKINKQTQSFEIDGKKYTLDDLRQYFQRSFADAAKLLGLSVGRMSRACRTCGLYRWPYKKLWRIDQNVECLQRAIICSDCDEDRAKFSNQIEGLLKRRQEVIDFPERTCNLPEKNATAANVEDSSGRQSHANIESNEPGFSRCADLGKG